MKKGSNFPSEPFPLCLFTSVFQFSPIFCPFKYKKIFLYLKVRVFGAVLHLHRFFLFFAFSANIYTQFPHFLSVPRNDYKKTFPPRRCTSCTFAVCCFFSFLFLLCFILIYIFFLFCRFSFCLYCSSPQEVQSRLGS
uniref:Uncharacterized protein n=1 Tax=Trypanosoma congolense (strain IL3000) TaxID=1068625 RepID=F9W7L3_TRYCI|nr:hypothetical protein, unlikely [Trypanosoma congolense IL3000]